MDQPVLADVHVARPSATAPFAWPPLGDCILKVVVQAREMALLALAHRLINGFFAFAQRLQLAIAIVDDSQGRREAKFQGSLAHDQRVFRIPDAAANHRIDIDVEVRV